MKARSAKSTLASYPLSGALVGAFVATWVAFLAVSGQSFWIDEANSAFKAVAPTWAEFCARMVEYRGSDLQMPGYMGLLWVWEKAWGPSEFGLRSLNILFFSLAIFIVGLALNSSRKVKVLFVLFSCSSAFVWAYLDEARPYMMQFLGSSVAAVGLINLTHGVGPSFRLSDLVFTLLGLGVLLASSFSTVFFVFFLALALLVSLFLQDKLHFILRQKLAFVAIVLFLGCGALLGAYYCWTFGLGAKASGVGKTNLSSFLFCLYESLGFLGLGPSRADLRLSPLASLQSFFIPLLCYGSGLTLFLGSLIYTTFKRPLRFQGLPWPIFAALFFALTFLFVAGLVVSFRVTGRHLMPVFPFALLGLAFLSSHVLDQSKHRSVFFISVYLVLAFASCLSLRYSARHAKDDYRGAAKWVLDHRHPSDVVWWAADPAGGMFYKVLLVGHNPKLNSLAFGFHIMNPIYSDLEKIPSPRFIVLSKLDVYDANGGIQQWLKKNSFQQVVAFPAFTIWAAP
jgi:hypothetical protein